MHENLTLCDSLSELLITPQLKQRKQAMILVALYELPVEIEFFKFIEAMSTVSQSGFVALVPNKYYLLHTFGVSFIKNMLENMGFVNHIISHTFNI